MSQEHEDLALIRSRTTGHKEPWLPSPCKQELSEGSWWIGAVEVEVAGEQYLAVFTVCAHFHSHSSYVPNLLLGIGNTLPDGPFLPLVNSA